MSWPPIGCTAMTRRCRCWQRARRSPAGCGPPSAGLNDLSSDARKPRPLAEALCWAQARRNFFKLAELAKAPLAIEAMRRIDAIFDAERVINGLPVERRHAVRQEKIAVLVGEFEAWMRG